MLHEIERSVEVYLAEAGCDFGAEVSLSKEWYETRDYIGFTLPRGYYSSLVITLGQGKGQNWWCIMFPPLCRDLATDDGNGDNSGETCDIGGEKYTVKFKALEIIADLFKKNS